MESRFPPVNMASSSRLHLSSLPTDCQCSRAWLIMVDMSVQRRHSLIRIKILAHCQVVQVTVTTRGLSSHSVPRHRWRKTSSVLHFSHWQGDFKLSTEEACGEIKRDVDWQIKKQINTQIKFHFENTNSKNKIFSQKRPLNRKAYFITLPRWFEAYFWKAKHIYYATTRLLPKETEGVLYYFNFESDLFLYVFNCSANSLSMLFYFKFFFFFDAFRTPHRAFDRRSVCNRTVNGFEDWTFFISLTKQLYQQK